MSETSETSISGKVFQSELLSLATGLVWKDAKEATLGERNVDLRLVDQFMAAKKGILTFDSIFQFDYDVIVKLGLPESDAERIVDDKYACPESYRDMLTRLQIAKITEVDPSTQRYVNYIEENPYYRKIYGLPELGDADYIYATEESNIDSSVPVHLLDVSDCIYLEDKGYLLQWKSTYPDKKYLQYIGKKRVDPYKARTAGRFDILWLNEEDNENIITDFKDCYERCTSLLIKVYYRKDFTSIHEYYEATMAMCILFMTINQMFSKYLNADINRDFYDLESIKQVYQAYGVPFYPSIPVSYHKKIVQNMNTLLSYKGSTKVFFQIFDIFDSKDIDIYSYYIMKQHKMTDNRPVFHFKEDGSLDNDRMYNIMFGQVALYDNPPLELADPTNHIDYNTMIADDPYWISDSQMMQKLYRSEFNYLEAKYMGIQTTFEMMNIVYESAYFIKMLLDNREALSATSIYYTSTNSYHSIFNITIYLCTLVCKKYGYEGLISEKLPIVAKHLGFNFKADITELRNFILNDSSVASDTELLAIVEKININSLDSVNNGLAKIYAVKDFLLERMWTTHSTDAYCAYSHIYKSLLTSDIIEDTYKLKDGTIAETFGDLLNEIDNPLYTRISAFTSKEDIQMEMDIIYALYEKSITNLKYLHFADGIDISPLMEQLFLLLKFFKSSEAELTGYTVIYTISSPAINYFRLMDAVVSIHNTTTIEQDYLGFLDDGLKMLEETMTYLDMVNRFKDQLDSVEDIYHIKSIIAFLTDEIYMETHLITLEMTRMGWDDAIHSAEHYDTIFSILNLSDTVSLLMDHVIYEEDHYRIPDELFAFEESLLLESLTTAMSELMILQDKVDNCTESIRFEKDEQMIFQDLLLDVGPYQIYTEERFSLTMQRVFQEDVYQKNYNGSIPFTDSNNLLSENKVVNEPIVFSDSCILIDEQKV